MLVFAACTSAASPTTVTESGEPLVFANQGGELEGHTPRGFPGVGSGLFVGDNLNPSFPEGDGVQTYLTFEIEGAPGVGSAVLSSNVLNVRGSPFQDLGPLTVELVEFDSFGPDLFSLAPESSPTACRRVGGSGITCDVTSLLEQAVGGGATRIQFRLRFSEAGDGDGEADLAMFFVQDSNTNEPGLFLLTLTG